MVRLPEPLVPVAERALATQMRDAEISSQCRSGPRFAEPPKLQGLVVRATAPAPLECSKSNSASGATLTRRGGATSRRRRFARRTRHADLREKALCRDGESPGLFVRASEQHRALESRRERACR